MVGLGFIVYSSLLSNTYWARVENKQTIMENTQHDDTTLVKMHL